MQMPNYLELATGDMAATKAFYTAAFGFDFTDYGPEYAGANTEHFELGLACFGETPPPLAGFQTGDIEAAERTVREAGGTIVKETYAFPGGRRFHFRDPGGNELMVYQYETEG
ncbi:MAG: VOC family protein [Pseudomonadota bacterium]